MISAPPLASPGGWHWRHLLLAPHRLSFLLATLVLVASALWWVAVQFDRAGIGPGLAYALSPSLVHAAVMTLGFMPLFFAGFLFTGGPRWLAVAAPSARQVAGPVLAQAAGWLLWLAGSHFHRLAAGAGLVLAAAGLACVTQRFWRLVRASRVPDRVHAKLIGTALAFGCFCLASLAVASALGADALARTFVLSGLWGFVVMVYVSVAHRMIPFFTSDALPMATAWSSFWVLGLLAGAAAFELLAVWLDAGGLDAAALRLARGLLEVAVGTVVIWLAFAWGLAQSLKVRLLAMLHLGFLWLGLGFVLSGAAQLAGLVTGESMLPLGALHAVAMGCLGSLMLAMVTRVTCGHSGRPVVADGIVWVLFWLLQLATVLRIAAAVPAWPGQPLLTVAALLWFGVTAIWGIRHAYRYGSQRTDGRPG